MSDAPKSKKPPKSGGRPDEFQTLNAGIEIARLAKYIPKHWKIWENACGDGLLAEGMRENGYEVFATDIASGFNYLDGLCPQPDEWDMSWTNPPYGKKDKWLRRSFEIGKPFALLLPITALGEQERVRMYKNNPIQVALPPARVEFKTPNGTEGGGWFYAAWFCYGLNLPRDIIVLD